MRTVRIHQGKTFSLGIRLLIAIISMGVIFLLLRTFPSLWAIGISIGFSLIPPAGWFATRILEINPVNKQLFIGSWCMGFRVGRRIHFQELEIKSSVAKIKRTAFSLPDGEIITNKEYRATLHIETGESFHLVGHPVKERIEEKIHILCKKLGLEANKNLTTL